MLLEVERSILATDVDASLPDGVGVDVLKKDQS
jgi:hypothetical protein